VRSLYYGLCSFFSGYSASYMKRQTSIPTLLLLYICRCHQQGVQISLPDKLTSCRRGIYINSAAFVIHPTPTHRNHLQSYLLLQNCKKSNTMAFKAKRINNSAGENRPLTLKKTYSLRPRIYKCLSRFMRSKELLTWTKYIRENINIYSL